jgi:hypothetical protein
VFQNSAECVKSIYGLFSRSNSATISTRVARKGVAIALIGSDQLESCIQVLGSAMIRAEDAAETISLFDKIHGRIGNFAIN